MQDTVDRGAPAGSSAPRGPASPRRGGGVRSLFETFAASTRDGVVGIDGLAYFREVTVPAIHASRARGEVPALVFDLDNTLFDTRYRTLEAAHRFGREQGIAALAGATLDDIGADGRDTCLRLGIGAGDVADRFQAFWGQFFWEGANLALDRPIERTMALLREAKAAGAEIYFLTGRIDALRDASLAQLRGVPDGDAAHLITKPRVGLDTPRFKAKALREGFGRQPPLDLVGFVTEGRRDLRHIQRNTAVPALWLDFPVDRERHELARGTPVLPW